MILQSLLSFVFGLFAVLLPLIILFLLRGTIKTIFFYFSPLIQLLFDVVAYFLYPEFYNEYDIWGWVLFYSTITSATLVLLLDLIFVPIKGIRKILYESTSNTTMEKLRLVFYLIYFITIPHLVFTLIYAFWGLLSNVENITLFESVYFSFSLIYSLPASKIIEGYKDTISNEHSIQLLYMIHVVISKAYEIVVLGFVASRLLNHLKADREA